MSPNEPSSEHLSAADTAAYLDDRLGADERVRAEAHLADCSECRQELVELRAVLANADTGAAPASTRAPRRSLSLPLGMAAAAVLVIALASNLRRSDATVERASPDATAARLATHAPVDGISPDRVVFAWAPAESGSSYRLTLTDSAGAPVWSGSTTDTVLTLPTATKLSRGRRYHWYVDALVGDGQTITSGVRSFSTAR